MRTLRLAIITAIAAPATAQTATYLVPQEATVPLGRQITLQTLAGDEAVAWPEARIDHFFARTAWTQENRDALPPQEGVETAAAWTTDRPGVLLLGLDLEARTETLPSRELGLFLSSSFAPSARKTLGRIPAEGDVTLLRHESAKALVRVEAEGAEPASIATSKTGQFVEIRPLMDPTALTPGSDLAVRLYARIEGAKGGLVLATNTTTGESLRATADDSAIANIHVASAGKWRLEFHAIEPTPDADADYALHTATLTFDVREVTK